MIDFTNCQIDKAANYGGSDQKRGIIYNGERYMLKMSDRLNSDRRNGLNSSYSNSTLSEHLCCTIVKTFDFDVQDTIYGYITTERGDKKPVVACKNFVPNGYQLVDFKAIAGAVLDTKPSKIPHIEDICSYEQNRHCHNKDYLGLE